jgi:hypothetical protein
MQRMPRGCGETTTVFRALIEMRILNRAVLVGFVMGTMASTTPYGSATW